MIDSPRRLFVLGGLGAVLVATFGMIAACGEDDPPVTPTDDAGDAAPSSEGGGDAGSNGDDASDGASIDGTGHVTCGATEDCDRNLGLYCCVTPSAGNAAYKCAPDRRDACNSGGDRLCDERADCQGTAHCCAELDASVVRTDCFYGTRCAGDGPKWEVCRPNAPAGSDQCEPGKTCKAVNCPGQGTLYLCDVPPGCQ